MKYNLPDSIFLFDINGYRIYEASKYSEGIVLYIPMDFDTNEVTEFNYDYCKNPVQSLYGGNRALTMPLMPSLPERPGFYDLHIMFNYGPVNPDFSIAANWVPKSKPYKYLFNNDNIGKMKALGFDVDIIGINSFIASSDEWCVPFSAHTDLYYATVYPVIYTGRLIEFWKQHNKNQSIACFNKNAFIEKFHLNSIKNLSDII